MFGLDDPTLTLILFAMVIMVPHLVIGQWQRRLRRAVKVSAGASLPGRPGRPARRLAVVACMDARLAVEPLLGLQPGDAHVLRNAGGLATDDMLRSLILSRHLHETREIIFLHHTDCALTHVREESLQKDLAAKTGQVPAAPVHFHAFGDQDDNLRRQMRRVKNHPWLGSSLVVRGLVYDVRSGALREVVDDGLGRLSA